MKQFLIRTASTFLAAVLFFSVDVFGISADKAILMDAQTGRILFEQKADERSLIASTTKIMTALIVCQQCNVLDRVKIPKEAVGIEGSSMYLEEGEILTIQELLYGLMLQSGNDAAVALAIYAGGTIEGFAEMMNDKARSLHLVHTHFENPNGLDSSEHYSTARDLAALACYAMENPIFRKTVSTKQIRIGDRYLTNHNKILWQLEGADGVKTGFTKAAGRILVTSAQRDQRRLVCVTINAPDDWRDHKIMMEHGFGEYHVSELVKKGQCLGTIPVMGGESAQVEILSDSDFCYAVAEGEQLQLSLDSRTFCYAPVVFGANAGYGYALLNNKIVGRFPVVYGKTIEQIKDKKISIWEKWFGGFNGGSIAENYCGKGNLFQTAGREVD